MVFPAVISILNVLLRASECNLTLALLLSAAALQASKSLNKCPSVPASPRPIADAKLILLTSLLLPVICQKPKANLPKPTGPANLPKPTGPANLLLDCGVHPWNHTDPKGCHASDHVSVLPCNAHVMPHVQVQWQLPVA